MRILVLSARAPRRGGKGDQARLALLLPYLARDHELTLVCGEPVAPEDGLAATVVSGSVPAVRRAAGALAALHALPLQTAWLMPAPLWRRVPAIAAGCDVALAVTPRSLRGPLPVALVVDHVDAYSFNMLERARGPESVARRLGARWEAVAMRRWERRIAQFSQARVATSDGVRELLPPGSPVTVLPAAWEGEIADADRAGHVRDIDVVLSGNMAYPPNREAARLLAEEIVPRVRARLPGVRAAIVGRDAGTLDAPGVELHPDVDDLHAFLRRSKVAVAPIRGAGSPFKVLEAAACGAAVVGSRWALEAYGLGEVVAEEPEALAAAVVRLLTDEGERARVTGAARAAARRHGAAAIAARFEDVLRAAAAARAPARRQRSPG